MMNCGIAKSHLTKIFQRERLLRILDVEADRIVGRGGRGRRYCCFHRGPYLPDLVTVRLTG